ncbi:helix-turn-helix domain-containing protein [Allostreptomyces psammosilenae]|uniref:Putative transcriptional regulator/DNA-binding XRE family transcriptional regulator n=1 Tax=Allostreptomyces psammosilenae TaxID=1892865 RepID=A0A852ZTP8_9ACTN|nr:helix-turn-helix domain-containing protein [Allostreptomyces psammosilenae]NYI04927.1 putative transcriptional regulator/DNA-binding XRE family transcriptional regulator [Allostreptomyces psammosilenae]
MAPRNASDSDGASAPVVSATPVPSGAPSAPGPAAATTTSSVDPDLVTLGHRIRHLRRARGLTLEELGRAVGRAPSQLSMLENGRREPRLSLLTEIAAALDVPVAELLSPRPPSRRDAMEIALERAQRGPLYRSLGLPAVKVGRRLPSDVLESLLGLHQELARRANEQAATPEEARRANAELRAEMRTRNNHFPRIEEEARRVLQAVGHDSGPLPHGVISSVASHLGFTLHRVPDLPRSTRSVTDLRHRRIYLPPGGPTDPVAGHDPRAIVLQTLGHFVLGHTDPRGYADFLRQRVEANYFAAAMLMPERAAVDFLSRAKAARDIAIEDFRDVFGVSYETAAHRFTNLATHHLDIPVHFMRVHESGTIYKAYENNSVLFPTDASGAIEGQPACRRWAARTIFNHPDKYSAYYQYTDMPTGTYWCTTRAEVSADGMFSVNVGTPYASARWFRGRDTTVRTRSSCPDPGCCRRPPRELASRWEGQAWPSARAHSHLLAALPPGTFPGVDDTEVYAFLDRYAPR